MHDEFILGQVKRCNRNLLLVNAFILIAVFLIMSLSYTYYYNFFFGPFPIDAATLSVLGDMKEQKKQYVTVTGTDVFHTGLQIIETTYDEGTNKVINTKVTTDYLYLVVNDLALVVKAPPDSTGLSYTGELTTIPADLKAELISIVTEEGISFADFDRIVLPYMVDAQHSNAIGYIGLVFCVPLFCLAVWNLLRYGKRASDPLAHPIYKKLEQYGITEEVAGDIDNDIASTGAPVTKKIIISDSWFVKKNMFGLTVIPLENILWTYKHVIKHKAYYVVPVGSSYGLVLHLNNKKRIQIAMSQKNVDTALEIMQQKAPYVLSGYSDVLAYLWNKNFPAFLAEIENLKNAV